MTDAERNRRRDAELEAFENSPGADLLTEWLRGGTRWHLYTWITTAPPANDDQTPAANDNNQLDEAA